MKKRASHDKYGKNLLKSLLGKRWVSQSDKRTIIDLGGVQARPDGIILSENLSDVECVVEIESTVYTQARSALLNLALHPAPKKLFVVIPAQSQKGFRERARLHYEFVWEKLSGNASFRLVILEGTGARPVVDIDRDLIKGALAQLQVLSQIPFKNV